jgi:hypothetical protein
MRKLRKVVLKSMQMMTDPLPPSSSPSPSPSPVVVWGQLTSFSLIDCANLRYTKVCGREERVVRDKSGERKKAKREEKKEKKRKEKKRKENKNKAKYFHWLTLFYFI